MGEGERPKVRMQVQDGEMESKQIKIHDEGAVCEALGSGLAPTRRIAR